MVCETRGFLGKMNMIFDSGELNGEEKVNMQATLSHSVIR